MTFHFFFFFNDTATTEIYTLSLHDALPIWTLTAGRQFDGLQRIEQGQRLQRGVHGGHGVQIVRTDRKSTRLNSSHLVISYAVFCLKKKKKTTKAARRLHQSPGGRHSSAVQE